MRRAIFVQREISQQQRLRCVIIGHICVTLIYLFSNLALRMPLRLERRANAALKLNSTVPFCLVESFCGMSCFIIRRTGPALTPTRDVLFTAQKNIDQARLVSAPPS